MNRPTASIRFMALAVTVSMGSTCVRRAVGCVLTDQYHDRLWTGFNGSPSGERHCLDVLCPGAQSPSGRDLDLCQAIHAEQNALIRCNDQRAVVHAYITSLPCMHCMKMLGNTGCQELCYMDDYPDDKAAAYWTDTLKRRLRRIDRKDVEEALQWIARQRQAAPVEQA